MYSILPSKTAHPEGAKEELMQNIYQNVKPETSTSQMQIENKGNTLEKTVLSKEQTLCKRPSQNQSDISQQRLTWNSKRCVSEELKRENVMIFSFMASINILYSIFFFVIK